MKMIFICSIILSILFIILLTKIIKNKKIINIMLLILSIILLIWKTLEFGYYAYTNKGIYPVEFSHISYFIVSLILIFSLKKLYFTAGLLSFISGLLYTIVALISPSNMINTNSKTIIIFGIISHMILLFIGSILLFKYQKYYFKDCYIPIIVMSLIFLYILLIQNKVIYPNLTNRNFVTLKIASFQLLTYIGITNKILNIIASITIIILLYSLIFVFTYINRLIYKNKKKYV